MPKTPKHPNTLCLCLCLLLSAAAFRGSCSSSVVDAALDGDSFTIQHSDTGKCLGAQSPTNLTVSSCAPDNALQLWKWGSGHRLFHVATSLCLALRVQSKSLALVECGAGNQLWWRCQDGVVFTMYQMELAVSADRAAARQASNDTWVRGRSRDNICQKPYRVVHTTDGNSNGDPCEFPFHFNGSWYHQCLPDTDVPGLSWCSTTSDYDLDKKKGNCLKPEEGCQTLFAGPEGESCYEFVPGAAVTWQQALDSCRSQGADLLSVSTPEDFHSKTAVDGMERMPERMWIGLHQLDTSKGWQWSDGSPVSMLRWEKGMPPASVIIESDCGVLNSDLKFESEACGKRLPYVCKKSVNGSRTETPESLVYKETVCEEGWVPWNGWCYKLVKDKEMKFTDAQEHCKTTEGGGAGSLASLHSIDSMEMLSTQFHADIQRLDMWIGLIGTGSNTTVFKWVDQAPVTFTYWAPNQPMQPTQDTSCVYYSDKSHGWWVASCDRKLPFMCQKKGEVREAAEQPNCPYKDGWRRHGSSCYLINPKEVAYKDRCNITIRNRFEQAFINRLLMEHISSETQYFWIGLQDIKSSGEYQWLSQDGSPGPVTYTNWGWFEPSQGGGCAVISTQKPVGSWMVKDCNLFKAGTICRRDLSPLPPPEPEPEPDPSSPCPDHWMSQRGSKYCYKVFHEERLSRTRTWEEAERFCQALGANLPSFTNTTEMNALHNIIRDSISDDRYFWVGLNRRNPTERSWRWSDGRPVSMDVLHHDFHEDDEYSRDCTAFKTIKRTLKHLFMFLLPNMVRSAFFARPFHCDARLEWVCQIPRGKDPKFPEWYNPGGHHETSIFIDGSEFWFVTEPALTFEEATLFCSMNGSKLASPTSSTAAKQIHQYIRTKSTSPKQRWWVNMRNVRQLFPLTPMQTHYSAYSAYQRCTYITAEFPFPHFDGDCKQQLSFVCERHNISSVEISPLEPRPGGLPCENGSLAFRNKCYTLMKNTKPMSFRSANEECKSVRGTLVTMLDQVEQDFVTSLLPSMDVRSMWIGLKLRHNQLEWVDQTTVEYVNFNPLLLGMHKAIRVETFDPESMDLCVFLVNSPNSHMMGSWDYTSCTQYQQLALCQHYADRLQKPVVPSEPFQVGNHTVRLLVQNLTWFEALEQCRTHDMDLASVADAFLQSTLSVHVSNARTPMWIGLFSEDEGIHYRWTNHSHTVFSRWSPDVTAGSCVYLDTDGFWKATECEEELGGAICHKPEKTIITTPDDAAVKCPHKMNGPNWIPFKNNCYTFQLVAARWENFKLGETPDTCSKLHTGAEILTIRNAEENEFIRQQLVPFQSLVHLVWLGMSKDEKTNQMKWHDNTNVQYSNWDNGRPNTDKPFLAGLTSRGSWLLFTNPNLFSDFKQKSIVACKLDKEPKEKYTKSPMDFQNLGSVNFKVVTKRLTWYQALEECDQMGGHLASVHDEQHATRLKLLAKTDGFSLWIGLSNQDGRGSSYEWSDGTKYLYKPPVEDEEGFNAESGGVACGFVTPDGTWMRTNCNSMLDGAICYSTNVTTASQRAKLQAATSAEVNRCPQGQQTSKWVQHQDHCYAFDMSIYNHTVYNMLQARSICHSMGAEVLTIKTKEENEFVSKYLSDDPLITQRVWLDVSLDPQGKSTWEDGSDLTYSNWMADALASARMPDKDCAVMMAEDGGQWSLASCKVSLSRVVCQTEAKSGGVPVALALFIVIVVALVAAIAFIIYKKKRAYFSSSVRYERTLDDLDGTSIITEAD